jgi:sulfur carrier protein ThiS
MKVNVKLLALPAGAVPGLDGGREGTVEAADGATVGELVARLGLGKPESYLTLVNGDPVAAGQRRRRRLADNDTLTVFPPIKGGRQRASDFRK